MNLEEPARCTLCDLEGDENTEHFLLESSAYDNQREVCLTNSIRQFMNHNFPDLDFIELPSVF